MDHLSDTPAEVGTPAGFGTGTPRDSGALDSPHVPSTASLQGDPALPAGAAPPQSPLAATALPADYDEKQAPTASRRSRAPRIVIGLAFAAVVMAAVVVGVVLGTKHHSSSSKGAPAGSSGSGGGGGSTSGGGSNGTTPPPGKVLFGGDGSTVTADDGSTFLYNNTFGGYWLEDPNNLYTTGGRANSWSPAINESWTFGTDRIYGVNLGGWLVLEPFIAPALYQQYDPIPIDEWTLSEAMAADTANGGLNQIETHYKTFITEVDFAQMAGAGLNWVRIPLPFWAISKIAEEPFLEGVAWTYFLKAIGWARKYGLRINLDLHTIPGSQNGFNHSGKDGSINFLLGTMGLANADRALDYLRVLTEFITQPQYAAVVPMFGIVNEPNTVNSGFDISTIKNFYYRAYVMMREITGLGNGPMISIHHAFAPSMWAGWLPKSDRIALEYHPYLIFSSGTPTNNPPASYLSQICGSWGDYVNGTSNNFGYISSGEFSGAINQCGTFVDGVGNKGSFENTFGPGSCDQFVDYTTWTPAFKAGMLTLISGQMDALRDWFFWTWKIGPAQSGNIEAPWWSYSLGLQQGWVPADPRTAFGTCAQQGLGGGDAFDGTYEPWQTAGVGATLAPATTEDYAWPPATLDAAAVYTQTGAIPTLPVPTPTAGAGSGWFDNSDTAAAWVPIAGCTYPDSWDALDADVPACATPAPS